MNKIYVIERKNLYLGSMGWASSLAYAYRYKTQAEVVTALREFRKSNPSLVVGASWIEAEYNPMHGSTDTSGPTPFGY